MTVQANDPKTDLTLSAAGEVRPAPSGGPTAPLRCDCECPDCDSAGPHLLHSEPGYARVVGDPACPECVARRPHERHAAYSRRDRTFDVPIRSERDPLTPQLERELVPSESEQRSLWGDR